MKPVNLFPDELRPRQRSREGRGPAHVVLAVLDVLLVLAVAYATSLNQVNSRKTEIAQAKSDIERAKAETAASDAFGDFHSVKETRMASVKELAAGRFDWERLMRELALVLPDDTWLLNATASTSDENKPGAASGANPPPAAAAPTGTAVAAQAPTLDLKGCALRQRDVAVLLVRLRKLYRAESVDLTESAEETTEAGGTQTSGDAGGGADTESCGNKRFKFEVPCPRTPPRTVPRWQRSSSPPRSSRRPRPARRCEAGSSHRTGWPRRRPRRGPPRPAA